MALLLHIHTIDELRTFLLARQSTVVVFQAQWMGAQAKKVVETFLRESDSGVTVYAEVDGEYWEDYCVHELQVLELPAFVRFSFDRPMTILYKNNILSKPLGDHLVCANIAKQSSRKFLDHIQDCDCSATLFVAGDRSSVGKSSICLALIASLISLGCDPHHLAYIKPVTQCEAEQEISRYCAGVGIECRSIGPVVFYKGFTRAYLKGETEGSQDLINHAVQAVKEIQIGKKLVIVDGVGYPSVGSICGISNADVAKALQCPVLIVGKPGVGDAVDSYNLNSSFFEAHGVVVLGAIFNKLPLDGFYSLEACKDAVTSYFTQFKSHHSLYGFMPLISKPVNADGHDNQLDGISIDVIPQLVQMFCSHVDWEKLLRDCFAAKLLARRQKVETILAATRTTKTTKQHEWQHAGSSSSSSSSSSRSSNNNKIRSAFGGHRGDVETAALAFNPNHTMDGGGEMGGSIKMETENLTSGCGDGGWGEHNDRIEGHLTRKRSRVEIEAQAALHGARGG